MTQEEYRRAAQDVIYLVGCALNGIRPDAEKIADLDAVYALASRHMLTTAVAVALESAGVKDQRSGETVAAALRKAVIFENAWKTVAEKLDNAGIWYMPLKGAVLKRYYPKYFMREMADHDILIDAERAEDVRAVMESLGFSTEDFGQIYHDEYHKPPVLNFEMHRELFEPSQGEKLYEYYRDVKDGLLPDRGCAYRFTPEDFYVYVTAHEYKHYSGGGTGLRLLVDTYVYLKKEKLDMAYVEAETEKLGIAEFEKTSRSLAFHLFGNAPITDAGKEMLDYILSSGTYGTYEHSIQNKITRSGGKLRYMLSRFCVPVSRTNGDYERCARAYPLFYKYKILLPLLPFYRIYRSLKNGRFRAEARAIKNAHGAAGRE